MQSLHFLYIQPRFPFNRNIAVWRDSIYFVQYVPKAFIAHSVYWTHIFSQIEYDHIGDFSASFYSRVDGGRFTSSLMFMYFMQSLYYSLQCVFLYLNKLLVLLCSTHTTLDKICPKSKIILNNQFAWILI